MQECVVRRFLKNASWLSRRAFKFDPVDPLLPSPLRWVVVMYISGESTTHLLATYFWFSLVSASTLRTVLIFLSGRSIFEWFLLLSWWSWRSISFGAVRSWKPTATVLHVYLAHFIELHRGPLAPLISLQNALTENIIVIALAALCGRLLSGEYSRWWRSIKAALFIDAALRHFYCWQGLARGLEV